MYCPIFMVFKALFLPYVADYIINNLCVEIVLSFKFLYNGL